MMYEVPENEFGITASSVKFTDEEFDNVKIILGGVEPDYQKELKKVLILEL